MSDIIREGDIQLKPVIRDGDFIYVDSRTGTEYVPVVSGADALAGVQWLDVHLLKIGVDEYG